MLNNNNDNNLTRERIIFCTSFFYFFRRRVSILEWHPTAENILISAGYDHRILIWNIAKGQSVNAIECHPDVIYSLSLNR